MSHVKCLRQRNTALNLNWGTICIPVEMITVGGMQSEGMLIDFSPTR